MVDTNDTPENTGTSDAAVVKRARRRAASRPAGPPAAGDAGTSTPPDAAQTAPAKKASTRTAKKAAPAKKAAAEPAKKATRASKKTAAAEAAPATTQIVADESGARMIAPAFVVPLFQAPAVVAGADGDEEAAPAAPAKRTRRKAAAPAPSPEEDADVDAPAEESDEADDDEQGGDGGKRRRRRRGGRGRKRRAGEDDGDEGGDASADDSDPEVQAEDDEDDSEGAGGKRRRRRRRRGADGELEGGPDDPPNTVVRVREARSKGSGGDDVTSVRGSTRLEAKKQRRREGREAGRRRAPIVTEAEFLARRESVVRVMVVRQRGDRTQIAVLEDGVLVEHYVTRGSSSSMVGNVYLGRVQNVLPSMEAAFVDVGRGRNAVLYAGEVNWDAAGLEGQPKRIELALKSGDPILVQVTKDPVGQKGSRLTSQISLPGRFLVYVPESNMTGISRKLPDTERSRLKSILKRVMPEDAGVIVRTAAEGAPEDALVQDVARLAASWEDITKAAKSATPPALLYSEPDLAIKVVRDIFNEDVTRLVVSGDAAWTALSDYIGGVAPDLADRLQHWVGTGDVFAEYRVDEQLMKALDRKVYLPSGGSLVIDRTEAMTVVDVNTGKFTGQGGNLEQTVTRNNIEAAEEIVRQLRLRDIGGIIVVDFIDMVLESNRDLVLRRLVECLGRDRTKHQVAEVTSLGLVQMTRKRIGSGLLESFSEVCEACNGRGIRVSLHGDHDHAEQSPKYRRPANAVDPADVAARALAAAEHPVEEAVEVLDLEEVREAGLEEVREELIDAVLGDAGSDAVEAGLEETEALEGAV